MLAACNVQHPTPGLETVPVKSQNCYYNWATQSLPELSDQIQTAINDAGLKDGHASAEAFGENCYDSKTNKPVSFTALETDFRITVKVTDLTDKVDLGNMLEKILGVLDRFPAGKIPGPQPGSINVSFQAGSDEVNMKFTVTAGKSARSRGFQGAALFEELQKK